MEKESKLFDKRFVYFMWDDELKGKKCFMADDITELRAFVNGGNEHNLRSVIFSRDESTPFRTADGIYNWQFAYYDPNYSVKWAYYKEGKQIQVAYKGANNWVDCDEPEWVDGCQFRVKPEEWCVYQTVASGYELVLYKHCFKDQVVFVGMKEECEKWIANHSFKPECPCEDGIDSKACVGCPEDEWRKHPFRPFKDCDELVEFWTKHYQSTHKPMYTKPLIWVRLKCDGRERLIVAFGKGFGTDFVEIGNKAKAVPLQKLFDDYEFLDVKPCGVELEE